MTKLQRFVRSISIRSKLTSLAAFLIAVTTGVIVLSVHATSIAREEALVDNVAGRQPMLVQRYLKETLLVSQGIVADPGETKTTLVHTADALISGGSVLAVQGNDLEVRVPAQTDYAVRAKLKEFRRLVSQLITACDRIRTVQPGTRAYVVAVSDAEVLSHVTANVGHDAVGRMTKVAQAQVTMNARYQMMLGAIGILLALALSWVMGRRMVGRLRALAALAQSTTEGNLEARIPITSEDEIGALGRAYNDMADRLQALIGRLEAGARRDSFVRSLTEAFEMAEDETLLHGVIQHAMSEISPGTPMEFLAADSSFSHLRRVTQSENGAPGCPVDVAFNCVAVRRGGAVTFDTSEALNACPMLRGRPGGSCSAVCVPVTFLGRSIGVLHATGPDGVPPSHEVVDRLSILASQAGSRIGTVQSYRRNELQATTDGLTGLANRRALEEHLRDLLSARQPFALAMADLDRFKNLNDAFGHEGGDRALRLFAETLRSTTRGDDFVARYGGDEFVLVFPRTTVQEACDLLERLRIMLSGALATGDAPTFTSSFGVTDWLAATTIDELLRLADQSLSRAKAEGRNRVVGPLSGV